MTDETKIQIADAAAQLNAEDRFHLHGIARTLDAKGRHAEADVFKVVALLADARTWMGDTPRPTWSLVEQALLELDDAALHHLVVIAYGLANPTRSRGRARLYTLLGALAAEAEDHRRHTFDAARREFDPPGEIVPNGDIAAYLDTLDEAPGPDEDPPEDGD